MQQLPTDYKPDGALGGLFAGFNAADAENFNQLELIKNYLANQREVQMQPLDVRIKDAEAARADIQKTPDMLDAYRRGYTGQMNSQDAAGQKAMQTWKSEADLSNAQNKNKRFTEELLSKINDLKRKGVSGSFQFGQNTPETMTETPNYLSIMQQLESGGKRYNTDGSLLTSKKGALGENQVMPRTATDPGYGVIPAKDNSPDEIARVGKDYMTAFWNMYEGDPEQIGKAFASYDAGPGRVAGLIKQHGKDWFNHLPQETKTYVENALTKFNSPNQTALSSFIKAPQRNSGIVPSSDAEYESIMAALVDTPEVRSKLITGDQKQSGEDYRALLKMQQAMKLAQLKDKIKDPKTAEEVIARLMQKVAGGEELSEAENAAWVAADQVLRNKAPVAQQGSVINPAIVPPNKNGVQPLLPKTDPRTPVAPPGGTTGRGAAPKKLTPAQRQELIDKINKGT